MNGILPRRDSHLSFICEDKDAGYKTLGKWTLLGFLDELDTIELLEAPECGRMLSEITQKQRDINQRTLVINSGNSGYNANFR